MPLPPAIRRERREYNKKQDPPVFPIKRCLNDNKQFRQVKKNKVFCCDACRREYNRFGSAFGPLREKLEKMVRAWMKSYQLDVDQKLIGFMRNQDAYSALFMRNQEAYSATMLNFAADDEARQLRAERRDAEFRGAMANYELRINQFTRSFQDQLENLAKTERTEEKKHARRRPGKKTKAPRATRAARAARR
jgi:hypothetical protein